MQRYSIERYDALSAHKHLQDEYLKHVQIDTHSALVRIIELLEDKDVEVKKDISGAVKDNAVCAGDCSKETVEKKPRRAKRRKSK